MTTVQFGGAIGPFPDRVQQRSVPVVVAGTCEYRQSGPPGNPAQVQQYVQSQILRSIQIVIGPKMETGELTFRDLGTGTGAVIAVFPKLVAAAGLEQRGIHVNNLSMAFGIDGHALQTLHRMSGMAPPAASPEAPQHDLAAGTFDLGEGHQLRVKLNGKTPENFLKDKASQKIWGWAISAGIAGVMLFTLVGLGVYVFIKVNSSSGTKAAVAKTWDGKSAFICDGNDVVALNSITATAGVKAGGNCSLTMTGVSITAPVAIEAAANAKVLVTGGSITGSTNSVVASVNAKVDLVGTQVSGKTKMSGLAKITGVP